MMIFDKFQPNPVVQKLVLILLSTCLEPNRLYKFVIFTGNGANAKSVIIALLKLMLGNLSFSATSAILWQPKSMGGCPELANLNKKRCVPISEFPEDKTLDVNAIKCYTGDDTFPARCLWDNNTQICPYFFFVMIRLN